MQGSATNATLSAQQHANACCALPSVCGTPFWFDAAGNLLSMNYDRQLLSMSQEVQHWERLRMAVPYIAMEIQAQREKYRVLRDNMLMLVHDYNKVGAKQQCSRGAPVPGCCWLAYAAVASNECNLMLCDARFTVSAGADRPGRRGAPPLR